jgi:hypothetical protein
MKIRWRWSLTITTGKGAAAGRPTTAQRPTLEATDGGQFEADGQADAGEMMSTRLPAFDSTERHGPDTFGRFR